MQSRRQSTPQQLQVQLAAVGVAAALAALVAGVFNSRWVTGPPATGPEILVFSDEHCRDCNAWIEYLRSQGFRISVDNEAGHGHMSQYLGVPRNLRTANVAIVDGYVIAGHVPAGDIRRLLAERPAARGIAVPGWPGASPGMEAFSDERKPYDVILFEPNGTMHPYAQH